MKYKIEEKDKNTYYILQKFWIFPWFYVNWKSSAYRMELPNLYIAQEMTKELMNPTKKKKKYHYVIEEK